MSNSFTIYACIAGGAVLVGGLYFFLKNGDEKSPAPHMISSAEENFDEKELRLKAKPLLEDYYTQAFAHYMILLCRERKVSREISMALHDQYGFIPPHPFVDWGTITMSRKEDETVELLQAKSDENARCDAEKKLEEILSNARSN